MMFSLTPTVPQTSCSSRLSIDDADAGGGAGLGVDDADLVVDQLHLGQVRKGAVQGLAQGGVEGVDRAVPFGHFVPHLVADAQLDRGLGRDVGRLPIGLDVRRG